MQEIPCCVHQWLFLGDGIGARSGVWDDDAGFSEVSSWDADADADGRHIRMGRFMRATE